MNDALRRLLILGVLAEVAIFLVSYFMSPDIEETFRLAARYSGRLSLLLFLAAFYHFASSRDFSLGGPLRNLITVFAVCHGIHWIFLAGNVYLNEIPLEPPKLAGGGLAYLMVLLAPFRLHSMKLRYQLIYFYYVCLVMAITYVARIKGDFEGAEPFWLHYTALGILAVSAIIFGFMIRRSASKLAG